MITDSTIRTASSGTAWKTTVMRGYIKKTALDATQYGQGAFKLTFKNAAGTEYDFYYNVDAEAPSASLAVDADDLILDRELLDNVLKAIWQTGTVDEFEEVRDGQGVW